MTPKLLRLAYVGEFLLAIVAIFTAWSEIAGQTPLDLMHWGWKIGFGITLAMAIVGFSHSIVTEEAVWTFRSARWLTLIMVLIVAMGALTFYYSLQEDPAETDDTSTISFSEQNAQDGRGIERPAERASDSLCSLAAQRRALCAGDV